MNPASAYLVLTAVGAVFCCLIPFALHRARLVRRSRRVPAATWNVGGGGELPSVTVQLPMFNESAVAARAIDAAASLDYPDALLEVQVLDDSNDETVEIVDRRVDMWRRRGRDVRVLRRATRDGFKAGALGVGLAQARGDFVLILDADFVPRPDLLHRLLEPMRDAEVGMVQASWSHLDGVDSWLTESQRYLLDGHFVHEQGGRYAEGLFFNFNGTAGLWRRRCLMDAGGWSSDTVTEDLDVSYRAQMAGWRFVYRDDVHVPSEVPETALALGVQQRRWAKGAVQTGKKILPTLLRGPWPVRIKVEAAVHLLGHLAHPLTWLLAILLFPSAVARRALDLEHLLGLDALLFLVATIPFVVFYWTAAERRGRPRAGRLFSVVRTLALGVGLSVPVTRSLASALGRGSRVFERTPKRGGGGARLRYRAPGAPVDTGLQLLTAAVLFGYLVAAVVGGYWGQLPFIVLFLSGYAGLGLASLREQVAPHSAEGVDTEQGQEGKPEGGPGEWGLAPLAGHMPVTETEVADEYEAA